MDVRAIHDVMVVGLIAHLALCGLLAVVGLPKIETRKIAQLTLGNPNPIPIGSWFLIAHFTFIILFFFPTVCFEFVNKLLKP